MTDTAPWTLRRAGAPGDLLHCLAIRHAVFVVEQGVEPALERDGLDEQCLHYLGFAGGEAVATARVRVLADRFKVQRVAVLPSHRGKGLGAALMRFMMADLAGRPEAAGRHLFLSSQVHAMAFYEKLGFVACSDEFMDAGIAHRDMRAPARAPA
ncbi:MULTISPECIES: GNAT family N-acetyltransferase [unclassified Roseitalea]|uniref:GNAT family N-acetyltransferase n=1 Tax=unclassified Roseitalea TaxID=2639107 RepID=UPI00273E1CD3|nr:MULTISPECIES: GNAT family N-acetyltransferase [unclassified Roseitalea]